MTAAEVLAELRRLERELAEQRYLRRADGTERVGEALARLDEIGSPAGILARSASALGIAAELDVVLVSRLDGDRLAPLDLWIRDDAARAAAVLGELSGRELQVGYPLIEAEVAQRHEPVLVSLAESGRRAAPALAEALGWSGYALAELTLDGSAVGFVHASRSGDPALDDVDVELTARFAGGLARVFERAVLGRHVERQREQLEAAAGWINGRLLRLTDDTVPESAAGAAAVAGDLRELLTERELDVLRLVARGLSNRAIATALMLGEGTVKYHVKNILRKLQARSRAQAVSRYVALAGGEDAA